MSKIYFSFIFSENFIICIFLYQNFHKKEIEIFHKFFFYKTNLDFFEKSFQKN